MTPGKVGIWIVLAIVFGLIGTAIGKGKGRADAGWWLGFLLGIVGVIIIACLSPTEEHKVQQAQRQYEIQAEAARRVGYQYPPKPYAPYSPPGQDPEAPPQPYSPPQSYAPYPPPAQGPYPQQPPPGQWQQPSPPGSWEQPAPGQWPGPQPPPPAG